MMFDRGPICSVYTPYSIYFRMSVLVRCNIFFVLASPARRRPRKRRSDLTALGVWSRLRRPDELTVPWAPSLMGWPSRPCSRLYTRELVKSS